MNSLLMSGMLLGLSAGLSPGPMLTLVVSQTLRHGIQEGVKVAFAPLLTDTPIVIACLLFLSISLRSLHNWIWRPTGSRGLPGG